MPVKKDASGRHSIEVETEVLGTPEEVWQAIATGPGISAWFVSTKTVVQVVCLRALRQVCLARFSVPCKRVNIQLQCLSGAKCSRGACCTWRVPPCVVLIRLPLLRR